MNNTQLTSTLSQLANNLAQFTNTLFAVNSKMDRIISLLETREVANKTQTSQSTKRVKKVKDPNAPSPAKNKYVLFSEFYKKKVNAGEVKDKDGNVVKSTSLSQIAEAWRKECGYTVCEITPKLTKTKKVKKNGEETTVEKQVINWIKKEGSQESELCKKFTELAVQDKKRYDVEKKNYDEKKTKEDSLLDKQKVQQTEPVLQKQQTNVGLINDVQEVPKNADNKILKEFGYDFDYGK
jgi:hypothetical protein